MATLTPPGELIGDNITLCLLQEVLRTFQKSAGFAVSVVRQCNGCVYFNCCLPMCLSVSMYISGPLQADLKWSGQDVGVV